MPYKHEGLANPFGQVSPADNNEGYNSQDYSSNLNEDTAKNLLGDNRFLKDLYDYYGQRDGKSFNNADEAVEYMLNDRRWRNNNTISIGRDVYDAYNQTDGQTRRLARIQQVYDALPFGVDGAMEAIAETGAAMLADPINLIGFGAGGQAARLAAGTAAKGLSKREITKQAMGKAIASGAKGEAVASGIAEGIADIGIQNRNVAVGLQDEVSLLRGAGAAAFGAVTGGAMGAGMGALGAVAPKIPGADKIPLLGRAFDDTTDGANQLSAEGLAQISARTGQNMDRNSIRRGLADRAVSQSGRQIDEGLVARPSARGDMLPEGDDGDEVDTSVALESNLKRTKEELDTRLKDIQNMVDDGDTVGADNARRTVVAPLQQKITRIKNIMAWPQNRAAAQAKIDAERRRMAEAGENQSAELDRLNKSYEEQETDYIQFVNQVKSEKARGQSQLTERLDTFLDGQSGELLEDAVEIEGGTVSPGMPQAQRMTPLNPPEGDTPTPQELRPQPPEEPETGDVAQETVEQVAQEAEQAPEVSPDERMTQINARLDGRKKGSIAYERKRLEREMANMPETNEDGTPNPERLTLQNRLNEIDKEGVALKEEQQSLNNARAEEQQQAADQLANGNPEQVTQAQVLEQRVNEQPEVAPTEPPEPVVSVDTQLNEFIDTEFVPSVRNIKKEFAALGMRKEQSDAIVGAMPKGNSKENIEARRAIFRDTVNVVRGQNAWQQILNRSSGNGTTDELFDENIAKALIEATVGEGLHPHADSAFREWRARSVARYAMDLDNEFMGLATIQDLLDVTRTRHGEGEFYDMVAEFWANAQKGILPSPDDGMPQFVRQQIATLPKEMQVEWNAFRQAAVRNLMKTGKLSEANAKRLIATQIDAMLDRFLQMQAYQATDLKGNVYSVKHLATRTMKAVDVNEQAIKDGHGEHIGRVQQNLRNVTTGNGRAGSGRDISSRMVGRVQSILAGTHEGGFGGRTFTQIRTTRDGKNFIYNASESARRLNEEAMLNANKSKARAFDETLRERSIEAAERAKDEGRQNVLDPRDLEDIQKELRNAEGAVKRAQKHYDDVINEGATSDDPQYLNDLDEGRDVPNQGEPEAKTKLENAQARLAQAIQNVRTVATFPDDADLDVVKAALKDVYEPLVYTDRATVVSNKIEADRMSAVRRYYEVEARAKAVNKDIAIAERQGNASKAVELKKERAKLNKRKKEMLDRMTTSDKKRIKADDTQAAVRTLANLHRELRRARSQDAETSSDVPESELVREVEDVFNVNLSEDDMAAAEYYANQEELAALSYQEMQGELAHLQDNKADLAPEEVTAVAKEIVTTAQEKVQSTKPQTRPKGEPEPHIVQIGSRAYNMAKDVQYQKVSGGTTKFFVNQRELGSVREFVDEDGKKAYQIIRRNGDTVTSDMAFTRSELYKKLAKSVKKELDEVLSSNNVVEERSVATVPTEIPDYHNTQRYAGVEDAPLTVTSYDPITGASEQIPVRTGLTQDLMPEGKIIALQITDPKHPDFGKNKGVRVLNLTSRKGTPPQTNLKQIVGNLKPDQFVVGSTNDVDAKGNPIKSGTVAAVKTFRPLDPDAEFVTMSGERLTGRQAGETESLLPPEVVGLESSPRARENRAINVKELDNIELNEQNTPPLLKQLGLPENVRTVGDLQRFVTDMEDVEWSKFNSIEEFDQFAGALEAGYDAIAKFAPNGVKLPNQSRVQSYKQLNEMLSGKDSKEIAEILTVFNMISGSNNRQGALVEGAMPVFDKADRYAFKQPGRHMADDAQTNTILIGQSNKQTDAMNFAHEMGHWAYMNMLTPAERMEFWQIARGYVGADGANIDALKKKLPGLSTSEIRSPSEFFANQFAIYVANRRQAAQGNLLSRLFKDVGRKAEGLVRRLLGMDNPLDEQLVEMFDRIMPDPKIATDSVTAGRPLKNQFETIAAKGGGSSAARMAAKQLHDLREVQIELEEALRAGGAVGHDARILADVLEKAAKRVYGKFGGRPGEKTHASRTDADGNVVSGGLRVTMLDSYRNGKPLYDANKTDITLPNGKTVKPFKYMSSRIARGRMLAQSYRIMRFLNDEKFTNALSRLDQAELVEDELSAELARLIATQEDGGLMSIPEEVVANMSDNSGSLASSFETEAAILRSISEKTDADGKLSALMVQQANDMIVALDNGIDEFVRIYNTNFRTTDGLAPQIDKAGRVYKGGNLVAQKYVKRVEKKSKDLAVKVAQSINNAETEVFGNASVEDVNPVTSRSPKEMTNQEILKRLGTDRSDTAQNRELKQELWSRAKALPDDHAVEATPEIAAFYRDVNIEDNGADALVRFEKALDEGNYDLAEAAINFVAFLKRNPVEVKSSVVNRAIDIETAQRSTPDTQNGIPGDAPAAVKEVLTKLTHRDKKVEYVSRTIMYRMLNLMGRTATDLVENKTTFMSVEDLYRMSGNPMPQGTQAAFAEPAILSGQAFNDTRKQLRQFAIGITGGSSDPTDVMHEIGHMLSRVTLDDVDRDHMLQGYTEAIEKGDRNALRIQEAYSNLALDEPYTERQIAEEWFVDGFGEWMTERVAKGNLFDVRQGDGTFADLTVKGYLRQIADRLYESVAYVLNGMIGRKSVRQMYRQMLYHGDMFARKRSENPIKSAVNTHEYPAVSPALAKPYVRQVIDSMSREKQLLLREFLGAGPDEDLMDFVSYHGTPVLDQFDRSRNPDVYLIPSEDGYHGPGVYTSSNHNFAAGYADRTPAEAYRRLAGDLEGEKLEQAEGIIKQIEEANEWLEHSQWMATVDAPQDKVLDRVAHLTAKLETAKEAFARLTGNKKMAGVLPMFVRRKNHFDVRTNKTFSYSTGEPSDVQPLLVSAQKRGYITEHQHQYISDYIREGGVDGGYFYDLMTNAMAKYRDAYGQAHNPKSHAHADHVYGRKRMAQFLKDEGYEGIIGEAGNDPNMPEIITFDPNHIKHVDADFYDSDRRGMYYSVLGEPGTVAPAGNALEGMMLSGKPINLDDMVGISRQLQEAGVPDLVAPIRRMVRKERPTAEDVDAVKKNSSIFHFFAENSARLRDYGATWLGDYIKPQNGTGIYERHDVDLADKVMPIFNSLKLLPDNKGWTKRWARKSLAFLPNKVTSGADLQSQPQSHSRILGAIRRGEDDVRKLNPQEQRIARQIIAAFEAERERMVSMNMPVGDARRGPGDYYVPQQWDIEIIRQNPSKAKQAFAQFFFEESRRPDFEEATLTPDQAHRKSEDFINGLLDTDGEIYGDDVLRRAVGDPFYNRVINLQPEQYDFMDSFLVNDLEGLLSRYFDSTTRKIALTEKFGVGGHGFSSYMTTASQGVDGAVKTLMSNKKVVYRYRQYQEEAPIEQMLVPALKIGEDKTKQLMETSLRMLKSKEATVDEVKRMILSHYDPQDQADPNLQIRVDSIVNALKDFPTRPPQDQARMLAEDMIDILNKRPLRKFSENQTAYKVSRNVKAFNSISLLGFTTLTSLGDKVLPLIRSGNMKAFLKAQKKYYSDPSYRAAAKNIGVGIENLMHDRMVQMAGEGSQKLQNSFFNFTLLTPWTNMNREIAGVVGFEAFKSEIARARRLATTGRKDSRAYATAVRFLTRYGLTGEGAEMDFLNINAPELTDIRETDMQSNKALRYALLRFTNEAIFTPNPNDIPTWAQTPWGSMFFQLKSFQLMMARMGKYVLSEAYNGNPMPAFYLATAGVGFGWMSAAAKDHVQSRGGEDNEQAALRERRITDTSFDWMAKGLGVKEDSMTDEVLGNYFEGLLAIGGLGLFAELLYNTAEQADNAAYGKVRMAGAVFGPSVGVAEDFYDVAIAGPGGFFEDKAARRREAVRSVMGRVPIVGGIRGFKEGVVDAVAGEAGSGGKRKQASKFGKSSGFGSSGFGKDGF